MSTRSERGFVPIDFLLISQMAILIVSSSLMGARQKAMDASFKSSASAVIPAAVLCCDSPDGRLNDVPGKDVCSSKNYSYGNYPDSSYIGKIEIIKNCDKGYFEMVMYPGEEMKVSIKKAVCRDTMCNFE